MNPQTVTRNPNSHPAPKPRRASLLWLIGMLLLVYSGVIAATDGIDFTVAGFRVRSRTWQRPALLGAACVGFVAVADRRRALLTARQSGASALRTLDASWVAVSPRIVSILVAVSTLVSGVVFSTYVAGGADSSGYLNQARLFAQGRVLDDSRLSVSPPSPESSFRLAPLGYRPAPDQTRLTPTYPPGYPLLMTPAFLIANRAAYLVVPVCGALAVGLTFAVGRRLAEAGAGAAAALLVSVSPTFLYQLAQPMSDVPATAAWLLAFWTAMLPARRSAVAAGAATGSAILIRPNLAPLAPLVWAACALKDPSRLGLWRGFIAVLATVPGVVTLALIQKIRYGSPWSSGYGAMSDLFAWTNVGPNLARYPGWMSDTHTPLIALYLLAPLWIVGSRVQSRPLFLILWLFAVGVVAAYLPYVYFQEWEWTYTRFLLPALPLMWLLTLIPIARVLRRVRPAFAALVVVPALVALVIFSLVVSRNRYAFELRDGERKYVWAAEYVDRMLPANSIIICMQHSGSLWFYTRRPILRWDHIDPRRLDDTIDWSVAQGYAPFIVADAEEFESIRQRFAPAAQRSLDHARRVARFGDAIVFEFSPTKSR